MKKIVMIMIAVLFMIITIITILNIKIFSINHVKTRLDSDATNVMAFQTTQETLDFGLANSSKIKKIDAHFHHNTNASLSIFLKDNGVAYVAGNIINRVSVPGLSGNAFIPVRIPDNPESGFINGGVTDVAAGRLHFLIVSNGIVYSVGANLNGELGNGTTAASTSVVKVSSVDGGFQNDGIDPVIRVEAGEYYSLILTKSGMVYSFGIGIRGELGSGVNQSSTVPVKVANNNDVGQGFQNGDATNKVIDIEAGDNHSMLLTEQGFVYTFGDNSAIDQNIWSGKLGLGGNDQNGLIANKPTKVADGSQGFINGNSDPSKRAIMMSAGWGHSAILTADGTAYTWGVNDNGRLGIASPGEDPENPLKVLLENVTHISADGRATLFVAGGKIYVTGNNDDSALQLGSRTTPGLFASSSNFVNENVKEVILAGRNGALSTYIIKNDGSVYVVGNNVTGQLGNANNTTADITAPRKIGEAGGQFTLTGTSIKHENTENYTMKYKSDVVLENVLLSGNAAATTELELTYDGTTNDIKNTYTTNNQYLISIQDGEEKEFTIRVKYNDYNIIVYKIVIDKKVPDASNTIFPESGGTFDSSCIITQGVIYCNKNIVITMPSESLSGYHTIVRKNLITNVDDVFNYEDFTNGKIYERFVDENSKIYELDKIEFTLVDGAGNVGTITIVLDNMDPRLSVK